MSVDDIRRQAFSLVRVTELDVSLGAEDEATLRLEILESAASAGKFRARIWRLEYFRIQSSFPQERGVSVSQASDERILKEFDGFTCPLELAQEFPSSTAAEEYVLSALARWLEDHLYAVKTRTVATE